MKTILVMILAICVLSWSGHVSADDYVQGYYRQDGTYVQPHYRTSPDSNPFNNYSQEGNVNPYTGQRGTVSEIPTYQPRRIAPEPLDHAPVKNWGSGLNPPKSSEWLKPDGWEGFE